MAVYRETLMWLWGIGALAVGATLWAGRPVAALGLGSVVSWASATALAIVLLIAAYLAYQVSVVACHEKYREQVREQMGDLGVGELVPTTALELRVFALISVSAGICEEVAFRGFVMPFLAHFVGSWAALVVASLLFGGGHAYQGLNGVLRTGVSSLLLGALFLATGTLLPSIVLHAAVDLQGGALGYLAGRRRESA
jgi:membrane protease YdiL (CAAX protease family)